MPNVPDDEAIDIVFKAIALSDKLSEELVLKGGNALKRVFHSPRASVDLDFTDRKTISNEREDVLQEFLEEFCRELDANLTELLPDTIYEDLYVQSTQIKPPNVDLRDTPAFEIKIGYTRRTDRQRPYPDVVKLEITLNDVICEDQPHQVDGGEIDVCSLNDIIAEKLRSLIQQKEAIRDRSRPNDVFDIWFYHTRLEELFDYEKITEFLKEKSAAKFDLSFVRKAVFVDEGEVKEKARDGFDQIEETVSGITFPSFEEAWEEVLAVIEQLDIPD